MVYNSVRRTFGQNYQTQVISSVQPRLDLVYLVKVYYF